METEGTSGDVAAGGGGRLPKSCPQCRVEYEGGLQFCPRDGAALRRANGGDDLAGQVIGDRYLVLQQIGSGGMGRVYLAQHLRMGRRCAVKVLRRALLEDESAQARFNREAESASLVSHPNVATIYDFGETSDGTVYLAMEYVPGEPLTTLLEREGPLPPSRAARIVTQIAAGLDAAHELPIVHRDLKPDNMMVARDRDGGDCVKIVDFGIAKAVAGDGATVTALGFVVGTPDYMAPEQAAGRPVDARADVYALGLVAFNALTGTLAFTGETPHARMLQRLSAAPRTLAAARPDVAWPSALQSVLDRALARDPAARYQSAGALGRDLAAAVADWQREPRGTSWGRPWRRAGAALRRTAVVLRRTAVVLRARVIGGVDHGRVRLAGAAVVLALAAGVALQWGAPGPEDGTVTQQPPAPVPSREPAAMPTAPGDPSRDGRATGEVLAGEEPTGSDGTSAAPIGEEPDGSASAPPHTPPSPAPPAPSRPPRDAGAELRRVEEATATLPALTGATRERAALAALADIARLLPDLRSAHDSVAALYHAAELHLLLGDASTACEILLRLREPARRTEFADNVDAILSAPLPVCRAY